MDSDSHGFGFHIETGVDPELLSSLPIIDLRSQDDVNSNALHSVHIVTIFEESTTNTSKGSSTPFSECNEPEAYATSDNPLYENPDENDNVVTITFEQPPFVPPTSNSPCRHQIHRPPPTPLCKTHPHAEREPKPNREPACMSEFLLPKRLGPGLVSTEAFRLNPDSYGSLTESRVPADFSNQLYSTRGTPALGEIGTGHNDSVHQKQPLQNLDRAWSRGLGCGPDLGSVRNGDYDHRGEDDSDLAHVDGRSLGDGRLDEEQGSNQGKLDTDYDDANLKDGRTDQDGKDAASESKEGDFQGLDLPEEASDQARDVPVPPPSRRRGILEEAVLVNRRKPVRLSWSKLEEITSMLNSGKLPSASIVEFEEEASPHELQFTLKNIVDLLTAIKQDDALLKSELRRDSAFEPRIPGEHDKFFAPRKGDIVVHFTITDDAEKKLIEYFDDLKTMQRLHLGDKLLRIKYDMYKMPDHLMITSKLYLYVIQWIYLGKAIQTIKIA